MPSQFFTLFTWWRQRCGGILEEAGKIIFTTVYWFLLVLKIFTTLYYFLLVFANYYFQNPEKI
jgi:hypothetical protein